MSGRSDLVRRVLTGNSGNPILTRTQALNKYGTNLTNLAKEVSINYLFL